MGKIFKPAHVKLSLWLIISLSSVGTFKFSKNVSSDVNCHFYKMSKTDIKILH